MSHSRLSHYFDDFLLTWIAAHHLVEFRIEVLALLLKL